MSFITLARPNQNLTIKLYIGEGASYDYVVSSSTARVLYARQEPDDVQLIFRSDSIAQEPNETFTLHLEVADGFTLPTGDGVFFVDEMNMLILDSDGKTNGLIIVPMHAATGSVCWVYSAYGRWCVLPG